MKKSLILIGTFLLAALSASAQAQNYYICDNGDDNNDGRSEVAPFKTYDKAMDTFKKMNAGDSILFCRGGAFNGSSSAWIWNNRCNAEKPCTIADYGDSSKAMPKIVASQKDAISFINPGAGSPDGGYILKNLMLLGSGSAETGVRLLNEVNDLLIENMHIEGFRLGVYYSGANKPYENGGNGINERIVLKNSTIINNVRSGFFGSCSDCLFENNVFENNGSQATFDHNFYLASTEAGPSENVTFRNNTLYKSAIVDGKCSGTSWVAHGILKNITIENNTIKEDINKATLGCWGIAITPGYDYEESFTNITIRNNRVINLAMGIGCSSCQNVVIEDNIILDEGDVMASGINVPAVRENSFKADKIKISNNIIALNRNNSNGINIGGVNSFTVIGNEISLKTEDSQCIKRTDGNSATDISSNICKTHEKVSVIDETTQPEVEVAEVNNNQPPNQEEEPVRAEPVTELVESTPVAPVVEEPVFKEPVTEVVESTSVAPVVEEPVFKEPVTEVVESTPVAPVVEEPVFKEPETEVVEHTPVAPVFEEPVFTELETEVVDSGSSTETVNTFERPSWATSRPTSSRPFTLRDVISSLENNYSIIDESECRMFARGKCLIR